MSQTTPNPIFDHAPFYTGKYVKIGFFGIMYPRVQIAKILGLNVNSHLEIGNGWQSQKFPFYGIPDRDGDLTFR